MTEFLDQQKEPIYIGDFVTFNPNKNTIYEIQGRVMNLFTDEDNKPLVTLHKLDRGGGKDFIKAADRIYAYMETDKSIVVSPSEIIMKIPFVYVEDKPTKEFFHENCSKAERRLMIYCNKMKFDEKEYKLLPEKFTMIWYHFNASYPVDEESLLSEDQLELCFFMCIKEVIFDPFYLPVLKRTRDHRKWGIKTWCRLINSINSDSSSSEKKELIQLIKEEFIIPEVSKIIFLLLAEWMRPHFFNAIEASNYLHFHKEIVDMILDNYGKIYEEIDKREDAKLKKIEEQKEEKGFKKRNIRKLYEESEDSPTEYYTSSAEEEEEESCVSWNSSEEASISSDETSSNR